MRVINNTETVSIGRAGGRPVEAVVRVSGIDALVNHRGFRYERRDPQAIVVRGEDDVTRIPIPADGPKLVRIVAPVAAYALIRAMVRRRRKR
jgi:hypothetical protein